MLSLPGASSTRPQTEPAWNVTKATLSAALCAVLLLIAGCGDDDSNNGEDGTTTEAAVPAPRVGECRGPIDEAINEAETDERPPVPCDQPHGSETAAVLDLPDSRQDVGHAEAAALLDAHDPPFDELFDRCNDSVDELWGVVLPTSDAVIPAGQFSSSMFLPTAEEWEAGARWVRCDAVIQPLNASDAMASTEPFTGMASRPAFPVEFLACLALETEGFVPCTQPHVGEAVALIFDFDFDLSQFDVANEGELEMVFFQLQQLYEGQCETAVTSAVGAERDDIEVEADFPRDRARAEADIANVGAVRVGCYAVTGQPRVGTVVGLGTGPL